MVIHISVVGTSNTPDPAQIAAAILPLLDPAATLTTINIDVEPVAFVHAEAPTLNTPNVTPKPGG